MGCGCKGGGGNKIPTTKQITKTVPTVKTNGQPNTIIPNDKPIRRTTIRRPL